MKKMVLVFGLLGTLLAGCSSADKPNQAVQATQSASHEKVLNDFYKAFLKNEFDSMGKYLAANKFDGTSPEQYIKNIKESSFKNNVKREEFMISEVKDIDESHKYAEVIVRGTSNGNAQSSTDKILLVKENGDWKLDYNLIMSQVKLEKAIENDQQKLSNLKLSKTPFGLRFEYKWEIKPTSRQGITIGWTDQATAVLETDTGRFTTPLKGAKIAPGDAIEKYQIDFEKYEGKPKKLIIRGVWPMGSNGVRVPGAPEIPIEIGLE